MNLKNGALALATLAITLTAADYAARFYLAKSKNIHSVSSAFGDFLPQREIPANEKYEHQVGDKSHAPKLPHPYFGYVLNRSLRSYVNREGFRDPHEYPYRKKKGEFVIGLFGGSVAYEFAMFEAERAKENSERLTTRLRDALSKEFKGRELVLLNFSMPGYKQPQQFFVASQFGETIDLAVNIEGFNEVEGDQGATFPVYYPTYSNIFYSLDPERNIVVAEILSWRRRQTTLVRWASSAPILRHSSLAYLFTSAYLRYSEKMIARKHTELNSAVDEKFPYYAPPLELEERVAESVRLWEKYLRLQNLVLGKIGVPSFYFIQPNQYLGKKFLSEEEKRVAISPDAETKKYLLGYDRLLERQKALSAEGLGIFDLTEIFRDHREIIYSDSCCHINRLGNEILEKSLLDTLVKASPRWKKSLERP